MPHDLIPPAIKAILLMVFPALTIIGGLKDMTTYTIPNWISVALIAAFPPVALVMGMPLGEFGICLGIGVLALLVGMGMFAVGWIGGGDAKLFAAVSLWIGWQAILPFLMVTGLCGGGLAVALLGLRSSYLRPVASFGPAWFGRLVTPGGDVPYGVAIAVGALTAFPASLLVLSLSSF
jgi:prepilin peptidase CpaA